MPKHKLAKNCKNVAFRSMLAVWLHVLSGAFHRVEQGYSAMRENVAN